MQEITPFLWFDTQAEEAANFYVGVFGNGSRVTNITHWPPNSPGPEGAVLMVSFELRGKKFIALNGGPQFKFNLAVSLVINCDSQEEIDHFWEKLSSDGGDESECGWLTDKYGLAWQIVPAVLWKWAEGSNSEAFHRVLHAVWQMQKLDLAALQRAYDGA
jgi:predicted 3-demethylubiquinone-9 3-methyltransferase (glyoxalase superfamily)